MELIAQTQIRVPDVPDGMKGKEVSEPGLIVYVAVVAMLVVAVLFSGLVIYFLRHLSNNNKIISEERKARDESTERLHAKCEATIGNVVADCKKTCEALASTFSAESREHREMLMECIRPRGTQE